MNKRLTEEERSWLKSSIEKDLWVYGDGYVDESYRLEYLLESEQAAWEEVERLKGQLQTVETSKHILVEQLTDEVSLHARSSARVEVLQSQLQDALKVMQEAIDDIDCEYPQTAGISLRKAIQRIQEGTES